MIKFPRCAGEVARTISELCRHAVFRSSVGLKSKKKKTALLLGGCARGFVSTEQEPNPNVGRVKFFQPFNGRSGGR